MATQTRFSCRKLSNSRNRIRIPSRAIQLLLMVSLLLGAASSVDAQTPPQQYVYGAQPLSPTSSVVSGFSKASQTGALSAIPGSPFLERLEGGLVAIDGQDKFLFVLNPTSNNISMFQIDQTSGTLTEVQGSPFAVLPTINPSQAPSNPISIATERSGKFVFVGYSIGDIQGLSAVVSLSINTSGPNPLLVTEQSISLASGALPIQLLTDPKGLHLYVGRTNGQNGQLLGGAEVYLIDSVLGTLSYAGVADISTDSGRSIAIDPQGRFFFAGWGRVSGFIDSCTISPIDGTASRCGSTINLGVGQFPFAMVVDNSGKFLHVSQSSGVVVYSILPATGALAQVQGPLTSISFVQGTTVADPMGPYIYAYTPTPGNGIHVYQVDQQSGNLTEIPRSPFGSAPGGASGIAISVNPVQTVTGPAATIFPTTANFGSITVGSHSLTQVFSIVNIGDQTLSINSISIQGTDSSSFSQSNTCTPTLLPNANCSVSITFTPASVGAFSATFQVSDNAPGSPQTLVLNGAGLAAVPAVTLSPAVFSFPTITQGTMSAPQTLTITSSGTAPLHVSSVALSGPNPSDFSFTNNCAAPVAPAANCTISLVFNPLGPGARTATLDITDDAPGSPQTLVLNGTGLAAVPAVTLSPAVFSFPTITQGTTSAPQTLTITSSGTAPLHVSSVALSGPNPSDFSFTNNCAAPVAPAANCTISLVFDPLGPGTRTATLDITDNAPGSPQSVSFSGIANPAFAVAAAAGSSTTASVTAGQTAQYQMQLTPGAGYSGTISLTCSGAPLGAACQVPASVSLSNGVAAQFTVTITTSGAAMLPPSAPMHFKPISGLRVLPLLAFALVLLMAYKNLRMLENAAASKRLTMYGALTVAIFCVFLSIAGCGGGSAAVAPVAPPPVITPSGTSTITVTMSAMSSSGKPLQLQPIQLTLTVK
jgi:6-phosphogluconolactonase (cycloisomerase 2 family)